MTDAQICNIALLRIGVSTRIDSLDENSTEAAACKTIFALARDNALASAPWPFATVRLALANLGLTHAQWTYTYSLPSDFLDVQNFYPASPATDFSVELNAAGDARVLLTNAQGAVLIYTKQVTNTALFSSQFCDALAWRLAVDLALSIAKNVQASLRAQQAFMAAITVAVAAAERLTRSATAESEFVTIRG